MAFIDRIASQPLMPEEYQRQIIESMPEMSTIMNLAYKAPNMSRAQRRIPVLSVLPTTYFTNPGPGDQGDIGYKKTTRVMWENKYLEAEELNVIVAIPKAVFADSDYDIWEEIKPKILEAYGLAFDQAVLYGTNAPAAWPTALVTSCIAAGNSVVLGTGADIYEDILGENGLVAKVEEDGFFVDAHVMSMNMRGKLRGLRDAQNRPIFKALEKEGIQGATQYMLDGETCVFPRNGSIIPDSSLDICGDWTKLIYAMRQDIEWEILTEAVIQDPVSKEIVYNLAQQNMIGLRSCMRVAWIVPNPINRLNTDEDTRFPFAVLQNEGS